MEAIFVRKGGTRKNLHHKGRLVDAVTQKLPPSLYNGVRAAINHKFKFNDSKLPNNFSEYRNKENSRRDWKLAVLVFRENVAQSWNIIQDSLELKLHRRVELSPMFADRVILWCVNEIEKSVVESLGLSILPGVFKVVFKKWSQEAHWEDMKVECSYSWIGVEGIPLNMWNIHVFKVIGAKCGGLIDVDRATAEFKFLNHARLQLKGNRQGFIPETLEIFCWGKKNTD